MTISNIQIQINKKRVFKVMGLMEDSPAYEEVNQIYEGLEKKIKKVIFPQIVYNLNEKTTEKIIKTYDDSQRGLYVVITLGNEISELSSQYFNTNQYLEGFLTDTMADDMLFRIADMSYRYIYDFAKSKGLCLTEKLSPGDNIPMKFQKSILEKIDSTGRLSIKLTEGYMLKPQKSIAWMHGVYNGRSLSAKEEHNCNMCSNENCIWREG